MDQSAIHSLQYVVVIVPLHGIGAEPHDQIGVSLASHELGSGFELEIPTRDGPWLTDDRPRRKTQLPPGA